MIRHMFRMIWNRKRRNALLIIEILFSFLVLFGIASAAIYGLVKYMKPLGFDYENVWAIRAGFHFHFQSGSESEIRGLLLRIDRELSSFNEIERVAWSSINYPYGTATITTSLEWKGQDLDMDMFVVDDDYAGVFRIPLAEGRWFSREDDASSINPIVINRELKEIIFGEGPAAGRSFTSDDDEYMVVGVIDDFRYHGELEKHRASYFRRALLSDTLAHIPEVAIIRVREGTDVRFEKQLADHLSSLAPGLSLRIENIKESRAQYFKNILLGLLLVVIIAGFLVFNVALGLFGVLWYSISRRRREIGLRRAMGAHAGQIGLQILGEALVLATFAIIAGVFIALQVPILGLDAVMTGMSSTAPGTIYIFSMACAAVMIYLLVAICALYPSGLASRIHPAAALHSE